MNAAGSHILAHYATGYEAQRLLSGPGQLERVRTEELLTRYLPAPPAIVLDVGGGPGAYARWLATKGYVVNLVDMAAEGALRPGDKLLLFTFGFGASWSCLVLEH